MGISFCGNKGITVSATQSKSIKIVVSNSLRLSASDNIMLRNDLTKGDETVTLELSIRCTNLSTDNRFSLLSPVAHLSIEHNGDFIKAAETEVQNITLNPSFSSRFRVPLSMRCDYKIKIELFDYQSKAKTKEFLGSAFFTVHEIASKSEMISKELINSGKKTGNVLVFGEELRYFNDSIEMNWEFMPAETLDPCFLKISRKEQERLITVFQTESRLAPYSKR